MGAEKNRIISLLVGFLIMVPGIAQTASVSFFDQKPLYKEPFANVRSVDTGVTINTANYQQEQVGYLEVSLGRNLPIATFKFNESLRNPLYLQFGLMGGFWTTLGYDKGAFPLLTQDFLISVPLELKWGNFTSAIKFNHISAHLGDGFDSLLKDKLSKKEKNDLNDAEEFLKDYSGNDDAGIILMEPFGYSRDFMSLHAAYDSKIGVFDSKIYCHGGYVHKMIPRKLDKYFVGSGFEAVYTSNVFAPYYASDFTYNQDTDNVDWSSEIGAVVLAKRTSYFNLRIAATMFVGKDRRGQLTGNKLKQFGIGFFIY